MGGANSETAAQRDERLRAERLAAEQASIAQKEKDDYTAAQEAAKLKADARKKRETGMQGGGRAGLMYKGDERGTA